MQLLPAVVVSAAAHEMPVYPDFGRLGFHCVPADPSGYADVVHDMVARATVDGQTVMAHDLNGKQAQALAHALEAAGCTPEGGEQQ